jgi:UDP-2,3-diacylglucosamine hydrolase
MTTAVISDIHVKKRGDEPYQLLLKFLNHPKVLGSEDIIFLGDVFDLMIGNFKDYEREFPEFFQSLVGLCGKGKKIYFVEGNHDFHLGDLFQDFCKRHDISEDRFFYIKGILRKTLEGKEIVYCHGDDIELGNPGYKIYKRFINSFFIDSFIKNFVTFNFLKMVGERASQKSKNRNKTKYSAPEAQAEIKDRFRKSSEYFALYEDFDLLVCGHSHVKDYYKSNQGFTYINNGFAPYTKSFIWIDSKGEEFIPL